MPAFSSWTPRLIALGSGAAGGSGTTEIFAGLAAKVLLPCMAAANLASGSGLMRGIGELILPVRAVGFGFLF